MKSLTIKLIDSIIKSNISDENKKELELFLVNSPLDEDKKVKLLNLINKMTN